VVFDRLVAFVASRNRRLAAALDGGGLDEREEGRLALRAANRFAHQRLSGRREELEEICAAFFGAPTRIEVRLAGEDAGPGQPDAPAGAAEQAREIKRKALEHPAIGLAVEVLGGDIAEIRPIRPGGGGR